MAGDHYITPQLYAFLRDLKKNNKRDWFEMNRDRYERDVRSPLLRFIEDFAEDLDRISPHFLADSRRAGGSLFRIHRDVRFSKDKSPYKTYTGIQFRHELARDVHAPGFQLHLEPGQTFVGVGICRPKSATLTQIRKAILDDPDAWLKSSTDPMFRTTFSLSGDSLKRAPQGVDPGHPLIEDLRRKDFIAVANLNQQQTCASDFIEAFARICGEAIPFMRFLAGAVGVPF